MYLSNHGPCREGNKMNTSKDDDSVVIWSGGNRCLDWSSFGRQEGWSGKDTTPFLAWLYSMKKIQPDIWIQECTPRFDMTLLEEVLGADYIIQQRCITPQNLGWPVSRSRQWSIGVKKTKFEVIVELNDQQFEALFFREAISKCDVFFEDSDANRCEYMRLQRRACERHQLVPGSTSLRLAECLGPGAAFRLQGYISKCENEPQYKYAEVVVANVTQDPKGRPVMMRNHLPCLLTRSTMVLLKSKARDVGNAGLRGPMLMTPQEHLLAMGWPLWGSPHTCNIKNALSGLSLDFTKHMAGNGMHVAVAGAMLLYALSCTRMKAP